MSCSNPKVIRNPRYKDWDTRRKIEYSLKHFDTPILPDRYLQVPCGKCSDCRRARLRDWRFRLLYEVSQHYMSAFVTLTFDDKNLAKYKDDPNRAVRQFLDACRKHYGRQLRHWFIAEFGTDTNRIHYHGLLFGFYCKPGSKEFYKLKSLWNRGIIWVGYVDGAKTVNYVVKYITKGDNSGKLQPRVLTSQGIGLSYITDVTRLYHHNQRSLINYIRLNGQIYPLPRFYQSKIFTEDELLQISVENALRPPTYRIKDKVYSNRFEWSVALGKKYEHEKSMGFHKYLPSRPRSTEKKLFYLKNVNYYGF